MVICYGLTEGTNIMLAATLLTLIGISAIVHSARMISGGNPSYAIGIFGILAVFSAISIVVESRKRKRFVEWLIAHRNDVQGFGADFEGHLITNRTELREFHLAISVVAFSFRIPSRYFIEHKTLPVTAFVYSVVSAFCGWWGIPSGPIYTLQALYLNLLGGKHLQIWKIYEEVDQVKTEALEKVRLRKRPFLSTELTGTHKLALVVIAVMVLCFAGSYFSQ
jgi:hypothetical protein